MIRAPLSTNRNDKKIYTHVNAVMSSALCKHRFHLQFSETGFPARRKIFGIIRERHSYNFFLFLLAAQLESFADYTHGGV